MSLSLSRQTSQAESNKANTPKLSFVEPLSGRVVRLTESGWKVTTKAMTVADRGNTHSHEGCNSLIPVVANLSLLWTVPILHQHPSKILRLFRIYWGKIGRAGAWSFNEPKISLRILALSS